MNVRTIRSALTSALILATLLTGFPSALAVSSPAPSAQASDTSRPRRGKNGSSVKPATPDQGSSKDGQASASVPAPVTGEKNTGEQNGENKAQDKTKAQPAGEPQSRSNSSRRSPAPFDRPALDPSKNGQAAGTREGSAEPARDTRQPSPTAGRESQADSSIDPDYPEQQRPQRTRPVLRRPDSEASEASQQDPPARQKPVLRRPSDPQDDGADRQSKAAPPARQSGDDVAAPQGGDDEPIKIDATLVNIPVLVSDRSGRYIPQLSQDDFLVYEDGTQQQVAFFTNEQVPFNVALVLDMSPSTADNQRAIQDAAIAFVRQLRQQDRVMIVSFDRSISYLTDFTSNRRELESAIRSVTTGSGTSVYDAVYETINRRMQHLEGRKAMILFSDGEDTTSNRASYDEAIATVTESDVLVYGLRYPGGAGVQVNPWPRNRNPFPDIQLPFPFPWPRRRRGNFTDFNIAPNSGGAAYATPPQRNRRRSNGDFMEDVATAGGGPVYDAEQIGDLSRFATKIADELRHVYVVSYYPTNPLASGGHRSIQIRVKGRGDIAVRHRRGYNARDIARAPGT